MQIIQDRRQLHEIPELDKALPKTLAYLRRSLEALRCKVFAPMEGSLCAWFDFGAAHTIAFRADCDALPIRENTGLAFASRHSGCMHACGHDGHMAIALEFARRLHRKATLSCNVLLVFQSAEETTGGARELCDTGVFEKYGVEAIFGLHLWPGLPEGVIASRKNEMLSRSGEVTVEITGRTAHIAKASQGLDAMAAGVEFYQNACAMEQAMPENIYRLLKFGKLESGTVRNAVAAYTRLEGSLRAFDDGVFQSMADALVKIGTQVESATGCRVDVHISSGYPAVVNPACLYDRVRVMAEFEQLEAPSMITEDFSWYQRRLPGMFFFLGIGDTPPLHAENFDFNEDVLEKGAAFFEKLAENYR